MGDFRMRKQRESLQKKTFVPIIGLLFLIILVSMNHVPVYAAAKVASIGSRKYTSLQKAVDSVKNGQTIKLLKNVSLKKTVVSKARNVKYTINLNEHTITGNSSKAVFKFKKNNKVTLKNGKIKHGKKYAGNILIECDDAVLTIAGGTYSNGNPVFDVDDGKLNINSGTVVGAVYAEDSDVTIKGGTIKEAYFNIYDESTLKITFKKGEIVAVNGENFDDKVKAIQKIEEIGASYAIGRDCNVGDTIIGIKGRVGFEAAAPKLIIEAHRLLEKSTLSKWQQYWKDQVANWYGMFLHESQYLEPVMPDIEAMLTSSQRNVNGTAILKLRPYGFETVGVDSDDDLTKSKLGEYGETQTGWTADEAKGFIKVSSTPLRVYYGIHKDEKR